MGNICLNFPLLGIGNESGSNIAAITMFKGSGIMDGMSREVCQNSLDAGDKDLPTGTPVKVKFELVEIARDEFEVFEEYRAALESSIAYWETSPLSTAKIMEFLANVKAALDNETIPMLVMSDFNTIGLNGVNAAPGEKSFWDLLVNTEGISIKQDDSSAGSYGIGKNAPFAYSALNLVFYNTLAKDGGRAFEGVTRLVTTQKEHNGSLRKTQPIGKYLYLEDEYTGRPILPDDNCPIANLEIFKRTEIGTDVAVVGFKKNDYPDWERATAVAIIKNFVLAILNGRLEVTLKSPEATYEINKGTLEELLFNEFRNEVQLKYTRQIYETVTQTTPVSAKIAEDGDLSIYVKYDDNYSASLSRFRSTGMLINTTLDVLPHFSVVIVVNDVGEKKLSKTLREAEPPQHTEWKAKYITDNRDLHNLAARYIRNITKAIQKVLDDFEKAEITDKMDAGVGNYLPDATDESGTSEGTDGLRTDVKISEITSNNGRTFFNRQKENAEGSSGTPTQQHGVKVGKKRRKKKGQGKIKVVDPKTGDTQGVTPGNKDVKIVTPTIVDHRTYYMAANKYRAYLNIPQDYQNVYIQYFAARDDQKQDALVVKNVKLEGRPRIDVHSQRIGPIDLKAGNQTMYVEFETSEIMAVIPVFSMEVANEKSSS